MWVDRAMVLAAERYSRHGVIVAGLGVVGLELLHRGAANMILYPLALPTGVGEYLLAEACLRDSIATAVPSGVARGARRVVTHALWHPVRDERLGR